MEYREHLPDPRLRPFVRCFWHLRASGVQPATGVERVVPDGCPEVIVNRAERFRRVLEDGQSREQPEVLLVGQFRRAITIAPQGDVDLIGVRFEPGGLHALLGVPMHELVDEDVCLGQLERRLRDELADAAYREGELARVRAFEGVLARRLDGRRAIGAGFAGSAVRLAGSGVATADGIAASLGIHRRSLERMFRTEIGLSPKLYLRIHRLQSVLRRLEGGRPARGWAELAAEHGYADQPHLIRDFRLLAGTTPERYLAEQTALANFFVAGELSHSSNPQDGAGSTLGA